MRISDAEGDTFWYRIALSFACFCISWFNCRRILFFWCFSGAAVIVFRLVYAPVDKMLIILCSTSDGSALAPNLLAIVEHASRSARHHHFLHRLSWMKRSHQASVHVGIREQWFLFHVEYYTLSYILTIGASSSTNNPSMQGLRRLTEERRELYATPLWQVRLDDVLYVVKIIQAMYVWDTRLKHVARWYRRDRCRDT